MPLLCKKEEEGANTISGALLIVDKDTFFQPMILDIHFQFLETSSAFQQCSKIQDENSIKKLPKFKGNLSSKLG